MSPRPVNEQQYDALLRQSRLAEPPLEGLSHLSPDELAKELASFAPPVSSRRQALILDTVTATISTLCKKLDAKLHDTRPLGLVDSDWFCDLFFHLSRRLDEMCKGTEMMKETYARAIDAKLRGDVEESMRRSSAHVRTIGGFIVQTLQELLEMLEKGEQVPHDFLWKDVVSLEHIDLDMLAWVAYCSNPKGAGWQNFLRRREPGLQVSNRRIALHRGFSLKQSSKPEFQVDSRQDSGFSTHYDDLLKAHPSGYR
ncbi:hypothetical protein JCM10296v2_002771 [Rhodotorula toruloides]